MFGGAHPNHKLKKFFAVKKLSRKRCLQSEDSQVTNEHTAENVRCGCNCWNMTQKESKTSSRREKSFMLCRERLLKHFSLYALALIKSSLLMPTGREFKALLLFICCYYFIRFGRQGRFFKK